MAIKVSGTEVISDDKRILNNEDLPDIRPSLLLDFANSKTLDPRITFTRGSTATYWDGKTTAKAEENLFYRSQDFENSYWSAARLDVTANATTAPDGTTTADAINQASGETNHGRLFRANVPNSAGDTTVSIYAKANTRNFLAINTHDFIDTNFNYTWFNLSTGAVGTTFSGHTASITDVGNGWYRCSITFTSVAAGAAGDVGFAPADTDGSTTVTDDQKGIYIWGAQLEQRSSATAYTATTSSPIVKYQPVLQTAASGEARFDHDPVTGESKGLLIEEARTNLVTYSEDFTNAAWLSVRSSITADTVVAPDGTLTGDKLVEDTTASATHQTAQSITFSTGTNYTGSLYVKAAEQTRIRIVIVATGGVFADADLSAGTIGAATAFSGGTATASSITPVGNGWYRITVTGFGTSTNGSLQIELLDASGSRTYTGDGYSGIYLWGAQLEEGSFPTSYIPTSGSTVTRAGDFPLMSGSNFTDWFNDLPVSAYVEYDFQTSAINQRIFSIDTNGYDPRFILIGSVSNGFGPVLELVSSGDNTIFIASDATTPTEAGNHKIALAVTDNDAAISKDGAAVATDTSFVFPSNFSQLRIGSQAGGANHMQGHIKKLAFYPKRLPNATLQAMTEA